MKFCINSINVLAVGLVLSAVSLTVSGYNLHPIPRTVRIQSSYQQRINNRQSADIPIGIRRHSYDRDTGLRSSVDDYGPQFASYLQNDVSIFTVGEILPN
jgi:hypothetical protein